MGLSISWIAVSTKAKADILQSLSLVDTSFLKGFAHPYTRAPVLQRLSAGCSVLVCQVEEHVMVSAACMYQNGLKIWSATHDSARGISHLESEGVPPPLLDTIHAEMKASQAEEGGNDAEVDCIFDVPVGLAGAICGYRHDRVGLAPGEGPTFTALIPGSDH